MIFARVPNTTTRPPNSVILSLEHLMTLVQMFPLAMNSEEFVPVGIPNDDAKNVDDRILS